MVLWAEPVSSLTLTTLGKIMSSKLVGSTSIADRTGWTVNAILSCVTRAQHNKLMVKYTHIDVLSHKSDLRHVACIHSFTP